MKLLNKGDAYLPTRVEKSTFPKLVMIVLYLSNFCIYVILLLGSVIYLFGRFL